jgi:hypothetical protein
VKARLLAYFVVISGAFLVLPSAFAHHGASVFDMKSSLTIKGTVVSFDWSNPHAMIFVDVKDDKDNPQKWTVEIRGGPNVLTKAGWNKESLKPGDEVSLIGHPAQDGSNSMRLVKVVLANGKELDPDLHSWF